MTKLWISSDLHLGHKNVVRFRPQFNSDSEHHNTLFENLATSVGKRDSLYLLGDVAFTPQWLEKISNIRCVKKTLILGNHDTDQKVSMGQLMMAFDSIHSLHSRRNVWFSHCPIHPQQMRGKQANIHGHMHNDLIVGDSRYVNVCVEQTDFKPITFAEIQERL